MARRSISKAMRVRIFDRHVGICHLCKLPINATIGEAWHVEHVKPLWEGGKDDETNMSPAHIDCHSAKSREEAKPRAKTIRQRAAHIGVRIMPARPIQSAPMPISERTAAKRERGPKQTLAPRVMYK